MKMLIATLAMVVALGAHAQPTTLTEGFDSGLGSFSTFNASPTPTGPGWFPGAIGSPQSVPGYAASNFLQGGTGSIAAWLMSPELTFIGQTLSFYALTADLGFFDGLTVMVGVGASTDINDFSALFTIAPGDLDVAWTQYTTLLAATGTGRIAFLYTGDFDTGDYVGVDTVSVTGGGTQVPEPASLALVALGLGLIGFVHWRKRRAR